MAINSNKALALGGVIVAGLVTAAANVGAFASVTETTAEAPQSSVDVVVAQAAASADDLEVVMTPPADTVAPTTTSPVTTYRIGEAGSVSVAVNDGVVAVTDLVPTTGWTAADPDDGVASSAYAVFSDDAVVIEFRVVFLDDALVPSVNAIAATP